MREHGIDLKVSPETVVFSNPHNELKGYSYSSYTRGWADIRDAVKYKMRGHRFSPHPYTIYSMRSTFIEDHLLKGTHVFEVAEMAGHSVMETQKTYARLNLRKKVGKSQCRDWAKGKIPATLSIFSMKNEITRTSESAQNRLQGASNASSDESLIHTHQYPL